MFVEALSEACELFFPDYDLVWILRTDASEVGVGYVLFQVYVNDEGENVHQPLAFGSQKFSDQAAKWHTYEKEAYAIFLCR
jgi:hypothetical protein